MTCSFLENLTLASLVEPVTKEEFLTNYWERKPLIVHRENPTFYGDLFTLSDFDDAIVRTPSYVKVANAVTKKNAAYKADKVRGLEATLSDMRDGSTLVLDQLHNHDPKLRLLCRSLEPEFGHMFQTNLYLTPPNGKGFTPHWDNHDVFILQVLGSKHWKIEKDRRVLPHKSDKMDTEEGRELRGDLYSFTLQQGDLIYIPRGYVHAAECGSEASLHITLGVTAFFWEDLLYAMMRGQIRRDPALQTALPLGFMEGNTEELVTRAITAFQQAADRTFLASAVEQFRDEVITSYQLDVAGQVSNFFQHRPISLSDVVGPRHALVYRLHAADDSVRLIFGSRSIVFPDFFQPALEYALKTPSFAVKDLPGELEDVERTVFVERLVQEGLIVRRKETQVSGKRD